jgi:hypothetical protein
MDIGKTTATALPHTVVDRWRSWLAISGAMHLSVLLLFPAIFCGCHFHVLAVPVCLAPVVWGFFTVLAYRTNRERILAYINGVMGIVWLYIAWASNIQFLFLYS